MPRERCRCRQNPEPLPELTMAPWPTPTCCRRADDGVQAAPVGGCCLPLPLPQQARWGVWGRVQPVRGVLMGFPPSSAEKRAVRPTGRFGRGPDGPPESWIYPASGGRPAAGSLSGGTGEPPRRVAGSLLRIPESGHAARRTPAGCNVVLLPQGVSGAVWGLPCRQLPWAQWLRVALAGGVRPGASLRRLSALAGCWPVPGTLLRHR